MKRNSFLSTVVTALAVFRRILRWRAAAATNDPNAGAPPPLRVERAEIPTCFSVDHPEQFPLTTAVAHEATSQLRVTGR